MVALFYLLLNCFSVSFLSRKANNCRIYTYKNWHIDTFLWTPNTVICSCVLIFPICFVFFFFFFGWLLASLLAYWCSIRHFYSHNVHENFRLCISYLHSICTKDNVKWDWKWKWGTRRKKKSHSNWVVGIAVVSTTIPCKSQTFSAHPFNQCDSIRRRWFGCWLLYVCASIGSTKLECFSYYVCRNYATNSCSLFDVLSFSRLPYNSIATNGLWHQSSHIQTLCQY